MNTVATKVKTPAKTASKKTSNKVITFRFTLNPAMEKTLANLQKRYSMLDKTEIVKVALSKLATIEGLDNADDEIDFLESVNSNSFATDDEFYQWWNKNKSKLRA